jgi:tungstate transport system permease protein
VSHLWDQLQAAIPLITHGNSYIVTLTRVTLQVAAISTAAALLIGLPIGLALGLGRFRGRRVLLALANASLALPPVVVGVVVLLLSIPHSVLAPQHLAFTLRGVYVVQALLALPYVVALSAAAVQALPSGLLDQARALQASRVQLAQLALREARIGVLAAAIAAMGATISEVGAVVIVGGNVDGYDQTLSSGLLAQFNYYSGNSIAIAIAIVLLAMILVLGAALTVIQQRTHGLRFRFRTAAI